jgi:hypothetical protein
LTARINIAQLYPVVRNRASLPHPMTRLHALLSTPLALAAACLCGLTSSLHAAAPRATVAPAPLSVEAGRFQRAGQPYHGIGLNYFDGFQRQLQASTPAGARLGYVDGFRVLAEHEIPFVRFAACGFYPSEWRLYRDQPKQYFALLDGFVREAEQRGVGLIPSLFWAFFAIPDLVGEPIQAWGDQAGQTRAFMRRYTTDVVMRYRSSPAIWAWEFGNEFLLEADLPGMNSAEHWIVPKLGTPKTRTDADKIRATDVLAAYREFAELVRRLDPHRPVMTGNTVPRAAAWHLRGGLGWKADSLEQASEVILGDNPDPHDTLSAHVYSNFADEPHYFRPRRPVAETIEALLALSKESGKPLWLGEFGASPKAPLAERRRQTEAWVALIEEKRVPLSALWVFDTLNQDVQAWNVTAKNDNAWALTLLRDANRRLRTPNLTPSH